MCEPIYNAAGMIIGSVRAMDLVNGIQDYETYERSEVCRIAKEWLGTPYRPHAELKGMGCDCSSFMLAVAKEAGLIPKETNFGQYDVHAPFLHRGADDIYIQGILRFCREITEAEVKPGDIVMYKVGRGFSHGAIVIEWPNWVIHSTMAVNGVIGSHGIDEGVFHKKPRRYFSFWGKK
jgi:cell wall-associated NlpC family hydrolase